VPKGLYTCFLSHYKLEAASDARYLSDLLRKMLRCPAFLDSSTLTDLRVLFEQGVHKSDVLVVMATRNYLTRPWCLLEILEAARKQVPVLLLQMRGSGFEIDQARAFVQDLETELPSLNSNAMLTIQEYLGSDDLTELKAALLAMLDKAPTVEWNASARDEQILAHAQELCEVMATLSGKTLKWEGRTDGPPRKLLRRRSKDLSHGHGAVLICNREEATAHARVLQSQLSVVMNQKVLLSDKTESMDMAAELFQNDCVAVLLLTPKLFHDQDAMRYAIAAVQAGRQVVPVFIVGSGYGFEMAPTMLPDLIIENIEPDTMSKSRVKLLSAVSSTIAVDWRPDAGEYMVKAAAKEIVDRVTMHRWVEKAKLSNSGKSLSRLSRGSSGLDAKALSPHSPLGLFSKPKKPTPHQHKNVKVDFGAVSSTSSTGMTV